MIKENVTVEVKAEISESVLDGRDLRNTASLKKVRRMDKEKRKELQNAYKNRTVTGGVYCIKCSGNGRIWLRSTTNMEGARNKVMSALHLKGAPEPAMQRACTEYGWESFSLAVLEELKKESIQTDKEFADDIAVLFDIWLDKYERGELA